MVTIDDEVDAIEAAYALELQAGFGVFHRNAAGGDIHAAERFAVEVANLRRNMAIALAIITDKKARQMKLRPYIKYPRMAGHPWAVKDLCRAYQWPTNAPGGGVIGIVELGGGWLMGDIADFFHNAGLPTPTILDVSVDGTVNSRCNPQDGADGEVALDIQIAGAAYSVATGKPASIRVYWSQDIEQAVLAAAKDGCDVCSISWGADESTWGADAGKAMEQAALAVTEGPPQMVVFAASGDNDSSDGGQTPANVDLPAACPHVIGCGGTLMPQSGEEVVWNDNPGQADGEGTGGGFSTIFPSQPWQAGAPHGPGRMAPDVAGNAAPSTGYKIVLYGEEISVGGTSAVAPLYAGLVASFGKKLGFITPTLWAHHMAFTLITRGDNGVFRASGAPSPCTGLGSPLGKKIAELFVKKSYADRVDVGSAGRGG